MAAAKQSKWIRDPHKQRKSEGLNQIAFWSRFGITQSGGSRYESGRAIPLPIAILMTLMEQGAISEDELARARASALVTLKAQKGKA
ncbi:helix-turn-helix domain-containing protein [Uliginosibacterium sp. sgz301328]|uniref:helix-turn-helix domain-containing protein n=1 Tax=Uliginosibacterium sp. sgz301328 TaxID=3243764 RepID=UPI00359D2215